MSLTKRAVVAVAVTIYLVTGSFAQVPKECVVASAGSQPSVQLTGTLRPIIIYCVNVGERDSIPGDILNAGQLISDYFERATFGNYHVQVAGVLRRDAIHAFVTRVPDDGSDFIVQAGFVRDILQQADALYDFSQYDQDGDGFVDYVMFTYLNYSERGTVGLSINDIFTTNDPDPHHPGEFIKIDGRGYMTGSNRAITQRKDLRDLENGVYDYLGIWFHELGHSLFNFPDMNHSGLSGDFNHYSIGGFDAMAGGGFGGHQKVQSPYNPWFCEQREWGSFTTITTNTLSASVTDFYAGGTAYRFAPSLPPECSTQPEILCDLSSKGDRQSVDPNLANRS
jgi:M6 family metalloprotease-like protein